MDELREKLDQIRVRKDVVLVYRGHIILDSKLAKILEEVERRGSLLAAVRSQGVSYSWAWSRINKSEELMGERLISVRRGGSRGGGAVLTDLGRELLNMYRDALTDGRADARAEASLAGGYDPLLERMVERLTDRLDIYWTSSVGSIARLISGEVDVASIHLYDPESGEFNLPFMERFRLTDSTVLIRGYDREMGLMFRRDLEVECLTDVMERGLRYVNLSPGSATRLLADSMLKLKMRELGLEERDPSKVVRGYDMQVRTHMGVAKKIARGEADVGFGIREVAETFGLGFLRVMWESYDFLVSRKSLRNPLIEEFLNTLGSEEMKLLSEGLRGYRIPKDSGQVIG